MHKIYIHFLLRTILCISVQLTVIDQVLEEFTIFLFIIPILLIPPIINTTIVMILSFGIGLFVDTFYNTLGINALACLLLSYLRLPFFFTIDKGKLSQKEYTLCPPNLSWALFIAYSSILILGYCVVVFSLEYGSIRYFLQILIQSIVSSLFTMGIAYSSLFLFIGYKKR